MSALKEVESDGDKHRRGDISMLRFVAYVSVAAGLIGGLFLTSISVGFGIGLIIEGIAAGAFLLVFANIAEDVIEIRKRLTK